MNEFGRQHPVVNFLYFLSACAGAVIFMHPIYMAVSFAASFVCVIMIKGKKAIFPGGIYRLAVLITAAFVNSAFNHKGMTIIAYLPGGNPLTAESVIYGAASGCMLVTVINWFGVLNETMTSDKFIYLFGKAAPSLSLILSMTLRFVPKFREHISEISMAQKSMGNDISEGSLLHRAKSGMKIISAMITMSMENAVETADSLKCRGYGLPGRTSYSDYVFDGRAAIMTGIITVLDICIFAGGIGMNLADFTYFPHISELRFGAYSAAVFAAYSILCFIPVITEIKEAWHWKKLRLKI